MIFILRQRICIIFLLFYFNLHSVVVSEPSHLSPCHDFFDYVCSNPHPTSTPKLPFHSRIIYNEVEQRQEYIFPHDPKNRSLLEVVPPATISKWLVEYYTLVNGVKWEEHWQRHQDFLKLTEAQQTLLIYNLLDDFLSTKPKLSPNLFNNYYTSLKNAVKYFRESKKPTSRKNPYYHEILGDVFTLLNENIMKNSKFTIEDRKSLVKQLNSTKVYFPYFDFNNGERWREAAIEYERTYHRLKAQISEEELLHPHAEKIIRLGALSPSIDILVKYMKEFTERFIFQSVTAMPTVDSFNYLQEVHASVLPRINPMDSEAVMTDTVFVLTHELMHSIYNLEPHPFEAINWIQEKDCLLKRIKEFGQSDNVKVEEDWNYEVFIYEDVANLEAIRIVMQLAARRFYDNQQLRDTLEYFISPYCYKIKNTKMVQHNPVGVSFNTAISQLPNFNLLYNCSSGDRMFTNPAELCETMAIPQTLETYELQKIGQEDLAVLSVSLNELEDLATEIDNGTNIYDFEIIESETLTSTSSSSSSEENEEEEEEEESEESQEITGEDILAQEDENDTQGSGDVPTFEDDYVEEFKTNESLPVSASRISSTLLQAAASIVVLFNIF